MNVYYVGNNWDGCYFYRCLMPLVNNGWRGDKESLLGPIAGLRESAINSMSADIVVFQRPDEPIRIEAIKKLKKLGKKIVFENDDTFNIDYDPQKVLSKNIEKLKIKQNALNEGIKLADLVTTTTEVLAQEYRRLNNNVVVIPNSIDPFYWRSPIKNTTGKVRIGLYGSVTSNHDYDSVIPAIEKLAKDPRVQLVVWGLPEKRDDNKLVQKLYKEEFKFWNRFPIEWHPLVSIDKVHDKLRSLMLDIMLIPRLDNYFNRCKSNVKFLEASMVESAVVAQGFEDGLSPYQDPQDAEHMRIVIDNSQWYQKIIELVENPDKRIEMGKRAREYVLDRYNINKTKDLWKKNYAKLL